MAFTTGEVVHVDGGFHVLGMPISFAYRGAKEKRRRAAGGRSSQAKAWAGKWKPLASSRAPSNWPPRNPMDWAASEKANQLYNEGYAILARPGRQTGRAPLGRARKTADQE